MVLIAWLVKSKYGSGSTRVHSQPFWRRFIGLDWIGTLLCLGLITSLLLPLQWGGNTKPWSDPSVIACFCVVSLCFWEDQKSWERRLMG